MKFINGMLQPSEAATVVFTPWTSALTRSGVTAQYFQDQVVFLQRIIANITSDAAARHVIIVPSPGDRVPYQNAMLKAKQMVQLPKNNKTSVDPVVID